MEDLVFHSISFLLDHDNTVITDVECDVVVRNMPNTIRAGFTIRPPGYSIWRRIFGAPPLFKEHQHASAC